MKFKEIASRLTGFSIPVFGISWNPPKSHVATARKVIAFLEDRRVLFNPYAWEVPEHCVQSAIEIRKFLTNEIGELEGDGLPNNLRAIRASCRKFLDTLQADGLPNQHRFHSTMGDRTFNSALGELRSSVGLHVAIIATQHGLDVPEELAPIIPPSDND